MTTVIDTETTWYQQLKGEISDDILAITDGRGKSGWEYVHESNLLYFTKNLLGLPWTNQLALVLVIRALSQNDVRTIYNSLKSINSRLKGIFNAFNITSMNQFKPDEHMYKYLKGLILDKETDSMRQEFFSCYTASYYIIDNWLMTKCDDSIKSKLTTYLLPVFSYNPRELRVYKNANEQAMKTRKNETDAIVPLYPQIRGEAHLRWNQVKRLFEQFSIIVKKVNNENLTLPVSFNYDDRDIKDPAVKYVERFYFRLWDKHSFVLAHKDKFSSRVVKAAEKRTGAYSDIKNEYFLEFINSKPLKVNYNKNIQTDGIWFIDLLKEGVLGVWTRTSDADMKEKKRNFLLQWGYGEKGHNARLPLPFYSGIPGVLTQGKFVSENQGKADGYLFSPKPIYIASIFGLTAVDLITTTGARINEILQIRNTTDCFITKNITDGEKPIVRYIFRVIPKGRTKPENFYISGESIKLLGEVTKILMEHYSDRKIPRVKYRGLRGHLFEDEPYLFQYNNSSFDEAALTACMRFILHGIIFQDQEGNPVTIKAHLLRHAFANHLQHVQKMPIDLIATMLHQKDVGVTEYYAELTDSQVAMKTHELHQIMSTYIELNSSVVRTPEELNKAIEEYKEKVGTYTQTVGGLCSVDAICPVKMACVGCGGKIPTPEKKQELIVYKKWAEQSLELWEKQNQPLEAQKMKAAIRNADKELFEIELIEQYRRDEQYEPELRIESKK